MYSSVVSLYFFGFFEAFSAVDESAAEVNAVFWETNNEVCFELCRFAAHVVHIC